MAFDYGNKQILVKKNGQQITIPACNSFAAATEIPGAELASMVTAGTSGYALFLIGDISFSKPQAHVTLLKWNN